MGSTALSSTQSTQPTSTLLLVLLMTGTREFWAQDMPSPLSYVTLVSTALSCQRIKSSQAERRCGPASRWSSTRSCLTFKRARSHNINSSGNFNENKVDDNLCHSS